MRTMHNYVERGDVPLAAINLPRKVRCRPRKKKKAGKNNGEGKTRIDREGRTYKDFLALGEKGKDRVVMGDSVLGCDGDSQRIFSLHFKRIVFQMYFLEPDGKPASIVVELDGIERALGSLEAFEASSGVLLVDRGGGFDDFSGMERSCLEKGAKRCRVFYCDAMNSSQKSECERNHAELRRILPKGRSDFDALSACDIALACSHANLYPRPALGGAPLRPRKARPSRRADRCLRGGPDRSGRGDAVAQIAATRSETIAPSR